MSTIYLLKYNNYYNRIVKKEDTLGAYLTQDYLLDTFENINFVPADGVDTTLVVKHVGPNPDYLIVADGNDIESRWFVVESDIIRGGQYRLTLHRDVIVDSYDLVVNAPCFIEKATLTKDDPFIFNKENISVNQIKTSETPLKDETGCAWVVGYIPKDSFPDGQSVTTDITIQGAPDIVVNSLSDWDYYDYVDGRTFTGYFSQDPEVYGYVYYHTKNISGSYVNFGTKGTNDITTSKLDNDAIQYRVENPNPSATYLSLNNGNEVAVNGPALLQQNAGSIWKTPSVVEQIRSGLFTLHNMHTTQQELDFKNLNGKIIYDSTTKQSWKISIDYVLAWYERYITSSYPSLLNVLNNNLNRNLGNGITVTGNSGPKTYKTLMQAYSYHMSLVQVTAQGTVNISKPADRFHIEDQPYDMFCIPYSDDLEIYENGTLKATANKILAVNMATQIGASTGSGNIYDIQLLPYCPVRYCIQSDGKFDVATAKKDYITDVTTKRNIGVLIWITSSSFTFNIPYSIKVTNPKVENETDMYRLVSPNYNGQFEFSAAMNNGVETFNVDCSYKPYNPYIHINPNFKNLYGQDFNDARGLICGGDFSLPQVSNAWANYQLSNKNYENIFNREIQNLQVQQKAQQIGDIASAIGGAFSGAAAGGLIGGVPGAIAGGVASMGAGIADIAIGDKLRAEALDYKRDMYGMQLGNIKALPTSITKTTAFTYNNKIFPILEYYTCTVEEKNALVEKLKYNGMTVGRIGKISDYLANANDQYIKGRIIRIEGVSDDFHYYKAISDEIYKGAFF